MDFRKYILLDLPTRLNGISLKCSPFSGISTCIVLLFTFLTSLSGFAQEADVQAGKNFSTPTVPLVTNLNKKAVGPALKGVSAKYDREWLYSWIKNSSAMIKDGDPQAVAVWEEYNKVAMNAFPMLSNADIDNISGLYGLYSSCTSGHSICKPTARCRCFWIWQPAMI